MISLTYDLTLYFSWVTYVTLVITTVYFIKGVPNEIRNLLFLFVMVGAGTELLNSILSKNSVPSYHLHTVYSLFMGWIIISIYRRMFQSKKLMQLLVIIGVCFSVVTCLEYFLDLGGSQDTEISYTFLSVIGLFCSVTYFYFIFKRLEVPVLSKSIFFWFNSAILVYFGIPFFVSIFVDIISSLEITVFGYIWSIQLFATVLCNLFIIRGIWTTRAHT